MFETSKPLVVFSHPNHELAAFGILQRLKPNIIFLTDGGGEKRIGETKKGLASIGLADRAIFLNHTEQSFYDALLRSSYGFFMDVALEVKQIAKRLEPEVVFCDAVEFYNPVHDMTLPILSYAFDSIWDNMFEIPLIYEKPGGGFAVQTVPDAHTDKIEFKLTEAESASKKNALNDTYTILRDTLGAVLLSCPGALQKETIFPASSPLRWPGTEYVLRYDQRAAELKQTGKIEQTITHGVHFCTVVANLIGIANG